MKTYRPTKISKINQGFGKENTATECWSFYNELGLEGHNGIDIGTPIGEKIYWPAETEGTVTYISTDINAGLGVEVYYEQDGRFWKQLFWHLSEIKCEIGQKLGSGDLIGLTGNTGKYTTGPHLHWGLKEVGKDKNGTWYTLNKDNGYKGAIDIEPYFINEFIVDVVNNLKSQVGLLSRLIELLKKLLSIIKQ